MKTIAILVPLLHSPPESRLAAHLPDFATLTKPGVMAVAVFTALVRMIIAPGHLDPLLGSIALLAITAQAGAADVLNMWCDIDAVMTRCPPAAFLVHGADGKAHLEPRAGQALGPRALVALCADTAPGQVR